MNLRVLMAWSGVWAVVVLGVVGGAAWFWLRHARMRAAAVAENLPELPTAGKTRVVSRFESPSQDEALDLVKRALAIREPGGVGEVFRTGTTNAEEIVAFMRGLGSADGAAPQLVWLGSMDANGLLIDGVLVKFQAGDRNHDSRLAMLTPDDMGKWRIDFDAFARTVEPPWSKLLGEEKVDGVMRVIVAADTYFNGPFADESQWVCHALRSPDAEPVMFGYCRRGSAQAAAMEKIIAAAVSPEAGGLPPLRRATLRVAKQAGGDKRQFEITRVLAEDWVMAGKAFDEGVQ